VQEQIIHVRDHGTQVAAADVRHEKHAEASNPGRIGGEQHLDETLPVVWPTVGHDQHFSADGTVPCARIGNDVKAYISTRVEVCKSLIKDPVELLQRVRVLVENHADLPQARVCVKIAAFGPAQSHWRILERLVKVE
jgi:hypothetical protein